MVFTVLGAVAELERSLIAERVRAVLRNARAKGRKLGRPRKPLDGAKLTRLRAQGASWRAVGAALGVAPATALTCARQGSFRNPRRTANCNSLIVLAQGCPLLAFRKSIDFQTTRPGWLRSIRLNRGKVERHQR